MNDKAFIILLKNIIFCAPLYNYKKGKEKAYKGLYVSDFMESKFVAVIGGINADITGSSHKKIIERDSNPGKVEISIGGVGRNIAENIARLGIHTKLFSAVGDDVYGALALKNTKKGKVDVTNVAVHKGRSTSVYLAVNTEQGDLYVSINDMSICDMITPEFLAEHLDTLNKAGAVVVDTNLPEKTLEYICENVKAPIFADAVSVTKSFKLKPHFKNIHTLKINQTEAEALSGIKINNTQDAGNAAEIIRKSGVKNVYITMGAKGVLYSCDDNTAAIPSFNREVVNTNGCGDSFAGALVYGFVKGLSTKNCAMAGLAAASICIGSNSSISPDMTEKNILKLIRLKPDNV